MGWTGRIATATALALAAGTLFAQEPRGSLDSTQFIGASVVTAYRPVDKIIPAQALQGERLERLNALSVADAIRYFSGVQIKDYGGVGGLKTINVRSMGTQHVGVFYDGIQLGNAQNGQIDLGKYSLENMESVTLYNGQKGTAVQSAKDYASASAVYLQSRTPVFSPGRKTNLKATISGGSFGTVNPSLLWEQKLGEKVSSSFNAEYLYTTGRYKFTYRKLDGYDTTAVRQNGDVRALRVEEGLYGQLPEGNWRLKFYFYDSGRGYPGAFVREEPGKFRHEDRQWDTDFFTQGRLYKEWGAYHLNASFKYAYDYLHYLSDPRLDVSTMYVDNRYRQQEAYASVAQSYDIFSWWDVDLAADWQYNTLDADLVNFVYPSRHTLLTALSSSLRWTHLKIQGSLLYTYVDDNAREAGAAAESRSEWTPTAVMQVIPFDNKNLTFRAFYKRIFRMPTLNDLYYTFIGNKYLKPEFTTQYNVGLTWDKSWTHGLFRKLGATLDAYYNEVENKIIATPASNQFQWTMVNLGLVRIRGIDAAVSATLSLGPVSADLRATYTFQKAQDVTDPGSPWYGGQIPYIPWHSGSIVAGIDYGRWHLNYSFIYTGERYESVANIPENHAQPWYTSDLSLTRSFAAGSHEFRGTLEVNNIFNQQYEVVQCYPMPGTNFRLILSYIL
ncbi:MAG: TonB-dependent receptor [Bacteroidales bacterium]|nr:TonB-dependent receptor [Bacteroidales bacterium]